MRLQESFFATLKTECVERHDFEVARLLGDHEQAYMRLQESLHLRRVAGDQIGIAFCLEGFASVFADPYQLERAAKLYGTAARLRERLGAPVSPLHRLHYDQQVAVVSGQLGASAFTQAEHAGRPESLEQTVAGLEQLRPG
jgi:hypothetical protein